MKSFTIRDMLIIVAAALLFSACSSEPTAEAIGTPAASVVELGDYVSVHYTGSFPDGTVFDSSEGRDPLAFQVGAGQMIPGFETNVLGMEVGETKTFTLEPSEAYGERNESFVERANISVEDFGIDPTDMIGEVTQVQSVTGMMYNALIVDVQDGMIALDVDMNHPLAGETLVFEVEVVDIE
jgi:peptidylprolyl isomerase